MTTFIAWGRNAAAARQNLVGGKTSLDAQQQVPRVTKIETERFVLGVISIVMVFVYPRRIIVRRTIFLKTKASH